METEVRGVLAVLFCDNVCNEVMNLTKITPGILPKDLALDQFPQFGPGVGGVCEQEHYQCCWTL